MMKSYEMKDMRRCPSGIVCVSLSFCIFPRLSMYFFVCLSVSLSVSLCISFCLGLCLCLSLSLSISLCCRLYLSLCLCLYQIKYNA